MTGIPTRSRNSNREPDDVGPCRSGLAPGTIAVPASPALGFDQPAELLVDEELHGVVLEPDVARFQLGPGAAPARHARGISRTLAGCFPWIGSGRDQTKENIGYFATALAGDIVGP